MVAVLYIAAVVAVLTLALVYGAYLRVRAGRRRIDPRQLRAPGKYPEIRED